MYRNKYKINFFVVIDSNKNYIVKTKGMVGDIGQKGESGMKGDLGQPVI